MTERITYDFHSTATIPGVIDSMVSGSERCPMHGTK